MAGWTGHQPGPDYSPYSSHENHRLRIETRSTEQAHLSLAVHGVSITHPKRFTMDLLNVILGEGMSSRLFSEIRDKLGLAYSIHSYADYFRDTGALTVEAGVEPKNLKTAVKAIVSELTRMKEAVPEQELSKAKELTKGRLLLRLEDTRNVASWLGGQETLMGRILTMDEVVAMVDRVTSADISELARQFVVGDEMRLAVVGPVKESKTLRALLDA